jgi:nitrate/nitrite transporter NarK
VAAIAVLGTQLDRYPHHREIREKAAADFLRLVYGRCEYSGQHHLLRRLFSGVRRPHHPHRTHLRLGPLGYFSRHVAAPVGVRHRQSRRRLPAGPLQCASIDFWSAIISGAGFIGLSFINGIVTFFLCFVIISLGASGISHAVTWPVIISRWFRRNRGLATGLAVTGPIFGSPIVILNAQIVEAHGWRVVLIGSGILILVGVTLLSMLVRDRPEPYGLRPDGDPPEEAASTGRPTGATPRPPDAGLTLGDVLHTKEFWLFTSYLSGTFAVNSAVQGHMIPYFQQDIGLTTAWAAVVMSMVFIISGIGRIGGGYLLDKMDYRLVLAVVAAMMGLALLYLQVVDVNTVSGTLPFALMFGVSFGCLVPMRGAVGSIMFGTRAIGKVLGILQGGPVAAGVIGPFVMGMIFDLNGNYSVAIWGLIVISAFMVPLSLAMASPAVLAQRIGAAANQRYE